MIAAGARIAPASTNKPMLRFMVVITYSSDRIPDSEPGVYEYGLRSRIGMSQTALMPQHSLYGNPPGLSGLTV
jgi:hypothetical protein